MGNISRGSATVFALLLASLALVIIWTLVNPLTAVLTLLTLIGYAVIYTRYLKWIGPQNIVLGGASGAAPAMLGWCAITGQIGWEAFALFLIIFVWTPPHFWALAIARRDEYAKAGVPMMPVIRGVAYTKRSIFAYALVLIPVSYLPVTVGLSGPFYLIGATLLGGLFAMLTVIDRRCGYSVFQSPILRSCLPCYWSITTCRSAAGPPGNHSHHAMAMNPLFVQSRQAGPTGYCPDFVSRR
jgi:protoheme IX farnesyltransferase